MQVIINNVKSKHEFSFLSLQKIEENLVLQESSFQDE